VRKSEKQKIVSELEDALREPGHLILTDYRGLTVKDLTALRRALTRGGGRLQVVKNRLFQRALGEDARAELKQFLTGPVAVTFVPGDVALVLKEMATFAQTHEGPVFKGGWVDDQILSAEQLAQLATVPPREELLGRLVGVLSAPLSQLVGVLQAVPRDLVLVLRAIANQRSGEAGAAPAE
jgi:large subunit ribosomal protein L10